MGNRILIWKKVEKGNDLDILHSTDYSSFYNDVTSSFKNGCPNWGNKVWFQGLCSEIDDGENVITYRSNETYDQINNLYDLIIYPMANFFGKEYAPGAEELASIFKNIKIPVYVIACGAQAKNYDEIDNLVSEIGESSKKFISSIYETGGEFALRGFFTKEFFDRLGFTSSVVTGCPSMYQLGGEFYVDNKKVDENALRVMFNGKIKLFEDAAIKLKKSIYFDQDAYFSCLFNENFFSDSSFNFMYSFYTKFGIASSELLSQRRIKHIADVNDWYSYIKKSEVNYSFGSRIHGTIIALLAGVPATLLAIDSRTQEMAEFFDIPCINVTDKVKFSKEDIYAKYLQADYTKFNATYKEKYLKYQDFLVEKGIVSKINDNNKFMNVENSKEDFDKYIVNSKEFIEFTRALKKNVPLFELRKMLGNVLRKIK